MAVHWNDELRTGGCKGVRLPQDKTPHSPPRRRRRRSKHNPTYEFGLIYDDSYSFQRLNAYHIPIMINVPNRNRIRGVVNPSPPVMGIRLRHDIFNPPFRLRIESCKAPSVQFSRPYLSILIWHGFVEGNIRS